MWPQTRIVLPRFLRLGGYKILGYAGVLGKKKKRIVWLLRLTDVRVRLAHHIGG